MTENKNNRFIQSLNYAFNGIKVVILQERHFRFHLFAMTIVIVFGLFFSLTFIEWCILCLTFALVLTAEMVNSAIERTVDLMTEDYQSLAKQAKDIAAGAVLISAIFAICIGLLIFLPKLFNLF